VYKAICQTTDVYKAICQTTDVYKAICQTTDVYKAICQTTDVYRAIWKTTDVYRANLSKFGWKSNKGDKILIIFRIIQKMSDQLHSYCTTSNGDDSTEQCEEKESSAVSCWKDSTVDMHNQLVDDYSEAKELFSSITLSDVLSKLNNPHRYIYAMSNSQGKSEVLVIHKLRWVFPLAHICTSSCLMSQFNHA